jgi:hypothetical protein
MIKPFLIVSLMTVLLMLPHMGIGQADPRDKERDRQERGDRGRDGFEFRGRDGEKDGEDRAYGEREYVRDFRKDRAEVERELRKAAAERDRALEKAHAEAAREGKPGKLREKQTEIWEKYEEKRYDILTKFEDKRDR